MFVPVVVIMTKAGCLRKKRKTTKKGSKDTALSKIPLGPDAVKVDFSSVELILRVDFIETKQGKDPKIIFKEYPFYKTISSDSLTVASSFNDVIGALETYVKKEDDSYENFSSLSFNGMKGIFGWLPPSRSTSQKSSRNLFLADDDAWMEYIVDNTELKWDETRINYSTKRKSNKSSSKRIPYKMFVYIAFAIQKVAEIGTEVAASKPKSKPKDKNSVNKKCFKITDELQLEIVNPCQSTDDNSGMVYAPSGNTVHATITFDLTPYIKRKLTGKVFFFTLIYHVNLAFLILH